MIKGTIGPFTGQYAFLSNFHRKPFAFRGTVFATAEHAYQSAKAATPEDFAAVISAPTAAEAKKAGRRIRMNPQFEQDKRAIMLQVLLAKFRMPELREKLEDTAGSYLVEINHWHDTYWGAEYRDRGAIPPHLPVWSPPDGDDTRWLAGENWLGRTLMMAREVLS